MGVINRDGALAIAIGADTSDLQKDVKEAQGIIDKLCNYATKAGEKNLLESLRIQKQVIKSLEKQYEESKTVFDKLNVGTQDKALLAKREEAGKLFKQVKSDLAGEKKALNELEQEYKKLQKQFESTAASTESLYTQRRKLREEMASLTNADGTVSTQNLAKYDELKQKYIDVETAVRRVNKERQLFSTEGNAQLAGMINGITGLAGAFTAAQGIASLFVNDNQKLAEVQKNLQAAMSITIGLQQAANTLSATSQFRIATVTKATQLWTSVQKILNTQLGLTAIQSKIFLASGIGALIVAVMAVVNAYKQWNKEQQKVRETQTKLTKETTANVASLRLEYERLRKLWIDTNGDIKKQELLILNNRDAFNSLGSEINNVNDANKIFVDSSEDFIKAMDLRAKSTAAMKIASEMYEEAMKKIITAETGSGVDVVRLSYKFGAKIKNRSEIKEDAEKDQKTSIEWMLKAMGWDQESTNLLEALGLKSKNKIIEGTKEYYQEIVSARNKSMGQFKPGSADYNRLKQERDAAQRMLSMWDESTPNKIQSTAYERQRDADRRRIDQMQDAVDLEIRTREENINQLDDSYDKEAQMRQLNYDKEYFDVLKQQERMLRAQQDFEFENWKKKNPNYQKLGLTFTPTTKSADQLPDDQKKQLEGMFNLAYTKNEGAEKDSLKRLLDSYQDYDTQRREIEKRFNNDLAELRKQREEAQAKGDTKLVEQIDRAIAQATKNKGTELMTFDFDMLKKSPEYVRAFEDLKNTSTETLGSLLSQLEEMKFKAAETMNPDELREYTSTIQSIIDELVERDPFKALAESQKQLTIAGDELANAQSRLAKVRNGAKIVTKSELNENGELVESYLSEEDAIAEVNKAKDDYRKASNKVVKAQKEVNEQMNELFSALSDVGKVIGGTAGEIIGFITDIGSFVSTTIEGVEMVSKAGAQAISTVEKASVILAIISAAIQLIQKLSSLVDDSHDEYLKYAEKIAEINKLRDAVNEYEVAVTNARHAEESWFSEDNLKSLKQAKEAHEKVATAYFDKLTEKQAIYENETGAGWLSKAGKFGHDLWMTISGQKLADSILGTNIDKTIGSIYQLDKYEKGTTSAMNNLRIETRAAKKGLWGSGIGGKSQKTEDLQSWIKKQKGWENAELFDEKGLINTELAQSVLDKYGDKLVGQTKETIEALVELKEQYDEYIQQLQEYVSSMYEPLVDNFVDSLWDWFDEGKDALDSFKDYASQTFRDIVSDMMRTIILDKVLNGFDDDIMDLYEKYASGEIKSEEELMQAIADRTGKLINDYESQLPALQGIMTTVTDAIEGIGLDLRGDQEREASKKGFASMSQDSADELNGRFTAMQYIAEQTRLSVGVIQLDVADINRIGTSINEAVFDLREIHLEQVRQLEGIKNHTGNSSEQLYIMNERMEGMESSMKSVKNSLEDIKLKGITIKK